MHTDTHTSRVSDKVAPLSESYTKSHHCTKKLSHFISRPVKHTGKTFEFTKPVIYFFPQSSYKLSMNEWPWKVRLHNFFFPIALEKTSDFFFVCAWSKYFDSLCEYFFQSCVECERNDFVSDHNSWLKLPCFHYILSQFTQIACAVFFFFNKIRHITLFVKNFSKKLSYMIENRLIVCSWLFDI